MDGTARRPVGTTGIHVSRLGIGGGSLANAQGDAGVSAVVEAAWQAGLRHFDTAALYAAGESERRLGAALRAHPRAEFVVSTKIGRLAGPEGGSRFDYSAAGAVRAVEEALERLGLERLDIVFVHDVIPDLHGEAFEQRFAEAMDGAVPALFRLKAQGVVGAVGIALRDPAVMLRFARAARFDAFMLAGGWTLLDHAAGEAFLPEIAGEAVLVAAPFETGLLATGPHPAARFRYKPAPPEIQARAAAMQAACARHGIPLAAAALQFPLRHPAVTSVVAGHQAPAEVAANLRLLDLPIPDALWSELASL